jgi:hypothetical protein
VRRKKKAEKERWMLNAECWMLNALEHWAFGVKRYAFHTTPMLILNPDPVIYIKIPSYLLQVI